MGGPAVVYFVSELREGHSFLSALGALALPVVGAAVVWLVHWEATTPDGQSRGTDRSDQ